MFNLLYIYLISSLRWFVTVTLRWFATVTLRWGDDFVKLFGSLYRSSWLKVLDFFFLISSDSQINLSWYCVVVARILMFSYVGRVVTCILQQVLVCCKPFRISTLGISSMFLYSALDASPSLPNANFSVIALNFINACDV